MDNYLFFQDISSKIILGDWQSDINNSNHLVVCMLNASKAFNRVNLFTLFVETTQDVSSIHESINQHVQITDSQVEWLRIIGLLEYSA